MLLLVSLVIVQGNVLGQETKKADQPKASKRQKKQQPPFQWVNPPSKWLKEKLPPSVAHQTFESPSLKQDVGYCIYLPPQYDQQEFLKKRFPVVYYLHGGRPGSETKSIRLTTKIDELAKANDLAPVIYIFVNGGPVSHYNMPDDPKKQGADVFIKELIPHIDSKYRTIAKREGRGLEGFSQGGRGTARLMFRYPELFCSAAPGGGGHATEKRISESGGYENEKLKFSEGDNTWDLARAYAKKRSTKTESNNAQPMLKILVHVGDKGFNYQNNLEWMQHLESLGIDHEKIIVPDVGHSAIDIYEKSGLEIMKFHVENFQAFNDMK
ncbi:MAG: alpha/beta hydrolase-fold protein [Planctomycetota bacterium]